MAIIKTKDGTKFLVDDAVYTILSQFSWHQKHGYAATNIGKKHVAMHRLIAGALNSKQSVDHINNNKFDNRSENLRIIDTSANNQKRRFIKDELRFKFLGISIRESDIRAYLCGKNKHFKDIFEAAKWYDKKAVEKYGDNALTNKKILEDLLSKLSDTIK